VDVYSGGVYIHPPTLSRAKPTPVKPVKSPAGERHKMGEINKQRTNANAI